MCFMCDDEDDDEDVELCWRCDGWGYVIDDPGDDTLRRMTCPECDGTGYEE